MLQPMIIPMLFTATSWRLSIRLGSRRQRSPDNQALLLQSLRSQSPSTWIPGCWSFRRRLSLLPGGSAQMISSSLSVSVLSLSFSPWSLLHLSVIHSPLLTSRFSFAVFLAKELEMRSLVCHFDDSWVYNVLRESAIPLLKLLDTYEKMYKAKVGFLL